MLCIFLHAPHRMVPDRIHITIYLVIVSLTTLILDLAPFSLPINNLQSVLDDLDAFTPITDSR